MLRARASSRLGALTRGSRPPCSSLRYAEILNGNLSHRKPSSPGSGDHTGHRHLQTTTAASQPEQQGATTDVLDTNELVLVPAVEFSYPKIVEAKREYFKREMGIFQVLYERPVLERYKQLVTERREEHVLKVRADRKALHKARKDGLVPVERDLYREAQKLERREYLKSLKSRIPVQNWYQAVNDLEGDLPEFSKILDHLETPREALRKGVPAIMDETRHHVDPDTNWMTKPYEEDAPFDAENPDAEIDTVRTLGVDLALSDLDRDHWWQLLVDEQLEKVEEAEREKRFAAFETDPARLKGRWTPREWPPYDLALSKAKQKTRRTEYILERLVYFGLLEPEKVKGIDLGLDAVDMTNVKPKPVPGAPETPKEVDEFEDQWQQLKRETKRAERKEKLGKTKRLVLERAKLAAEAVGRVGHDNATPSSGPGAAPANASPATATATPATTKSTGVGGAAPPGNWSIGGSRSLATSRSGYGKPKGGGGGKHGGSGSGGGKRSGDSTGSGGGHDSKKLAADIFATLFGTKDKIMPSGSQPIVPPMAQPPPPPSQQSPKAADESDQAKSGRDVKPYLSGASKVAMGTPIVGQPPPPGPGGLTSELKEAVTEMLEGSRQEALEASQQSEWGPSVAELKEGFAPSQTMLEELSKDDEEAEGEDDTDAEEAEGTDTSQGDDEEDLFSDDEDNLLKYILKREWDMHNPKEINLPHLRRPLEPRPTFDGLKPIVFETGRTMEPDIVMAPKNQLNFVQRKVRLRIHVPSLGLPPLVEDRLLGLVGQRYNPATKVLKLVGDRYPNQKVNGEFVKQLFAELLRLSFLADPRYVPFTDLEMDPREFRKVELPKEVEDVFKELEEEKQKGKAAAGGGQQKEKGKGKVKATGTAAVATPKQTPNPATFDENDPLAALIGQTQTDSDTPVPAAPFNFIVKPVSKNMNLLKKPEPPKPDPSRVHKLFKFPPAKYPSPDVLSRHAEAQQKLLQDLVLSDVDWVKERDEKRRMLAAADTATSTHTSVTSSSK